MPERNYDVEPDNRTCEACGKKFTNAYFTWAFHQAVCKREKEKANERKRKHKTD